MSCLEGAMQSRRKATHLLLIMTIASTGLAQETTGHSPGQQSARTRAVLLGTGTPVPDPVGGEFLRFGMTVQEASVLLRCIEARNITPGQLAVRLGRDKGMITRFIDRLESSGLITRGINSRDRRFSVLKPTGKGKQVARDLASQFDHIRKELFVGTSESDVRRLSKALAQLQKNAADIGSPQKCAAVRQHRRIGGHEVKEEGPQTGQSLLAAEIWGASRS
jgi:DNA-binding MarR family transcriptional regulator